MKTALVRAFLETRRQPLAAEEDGLLLDDLCGQAPDFCLAALGDGATHPARKARLLACLVRAPAGEAIERDAIVCALRTLPDGELLQVLDGLRLRRINNRRARQIGLRALVGHERLADLAAAHRLRLVRIFKHLLGERTWSSVRRSLGTQSPETDRYLHRVVLRYAPQAEPAREALCFLAGVGFETPKPQPKPWLVVPWLSRRPKGQFEFRHEALRQSLAARRTLEAGEGMPRATLFGLRGTYHRHTPVKLVRRLSAPPARRGPADGPLTAALKETLSGQKRPALAEVFAQHRSAAEAKPLVDATVAVVLDLSGSAVSSGERLNHPAALGLALVGVLERQVREVAVFQVGGSDSLDGPHLPRPDGPTDLASALIQAAHTTADAILVVTDGYENLRQGDAAQVVEGLRRLGIGVPVWQVVPVFASAENLARRRLGENIPLLAVQHETAAGELTAHLVLAKAPEEIAPATVRTIGELLFRGA